MKKYFLLAAAAATVLAVSCNKEKNQPKVDPTPGTEIEDNTPQPILFGSNMGVVKAPITKGDGAIDKWSDIGTGKLYVYGVVNTSTNHETPTYGAFTTPANIKINNVAADAPNTNNAGLDYRDPIDVYETGTTPFYYDDQKKYDFYGYFVDNAATIATGTNPEVTAEKITLKNITINGTQDIMWANTDKVADEAARDNRADKYVALNQLYSDVSARRGVKPNLNFQHQLSRFVFNVKAADDIVANGAPTTQNGKVTIKDIQLESKTQAELLIVGTPAENTSRLTFSGDASYLDVESDMVNLTTSYQTFGEAMVAPGGTAYNFKIHFYQTGSSFVPGTTDNPYERTLVIDFADDSIVHEGSVNSPKAEAGKKYVVNVIIYGLEEIKITVSLVEWEDADILDIDPDEGEDPAGRDVDATLTIPAVDNIPVGGTATINIFGITAQNGAHEDIEDEELEDLQKSIYFTSSNKGVARVDPRTGKITAVAVGTATITATASTAKYYATGTVGVEVVAAAAPATTPVEINCADNFNIIMGGESVSLAKGAGNVTVSDGYAGTLTYTKKTDYAYANVSDAGVVSLVDGAVANNTFVITITAPANGDFTEATKDVTFTVQAAAAPDPQVEITCDNVAMTIGGGVAVLHPTFSANYSGTVTYSTNAGAANFTINAANGEITWGTNPTPGNYSVIIDAGADAVNHYSANTKDVTVTINPAS